jgi:hypothetical protein
MARTDTSKAKDPEDRCPNCGYCPHCGQSKQQALPPTYIPYPVYPYPYVRPWVSPYPYTIYGTSSTVTTTTTPSYGTTYTIDMSRSNSQGTYTSGYLQVNA